jgi:DNA polymerase-1
LLPIIIPTIREEYGVNVQNIPRTQKDVKRGFIPKLDAFFFFDYKAIEVRLLAYYLAMGIKDYSLVEEITAGLDPHYETAKGLYGRSDISDEERQVGKTLNFSIIYGGGTKTIMRQLGVEYQEAKRLLGAYHDTRPGINRLSNSITRTLDDRGYLINVSGRHLHVQESHKALNALIQGSAADIIRQACINVSRFLDEHACASHIVNIIHDELMIDVSRSEYDLVTANVPQLMTPQAVHKIIPIEVDCEWSTTNWAEKEEYGRSEEIVA